MNPAMPWIEHLMQDEGLSYEAALEMLEGYEFIPYVENGEHMATLLKRNAEVHFAGFKQYRGKGYITRRRLREFLEPILKREGFLTTKLADGEPDTFIKKLGFVEMARFGDKRVFMLTAIRALEKKQ